MMDEQSILAFGQDSGAVAVMQKVKWDHFPSLFSSGWGAGTDRASSTFKRQPQTHLHEYRMALCIGHCKVLFSLCALWLQIYYLLNEVSVGKIGSDFKEDGEKIKKEQGDK